MNFGQDVPEPARRGFPDPAETVDGRSSYLVLLQLPKHPRGLEAISRPISGRAKLLLSRGWARLQLGGSLALPVLKRVLIGQRHALLKDDDEVN